MINSIDITLQLNYDLQIYHGTYHAFDDDAGHHHNGDGCAFYDASSCHHHHFHQSNLAYDDGDDASCVYASSLYHGYGYGYGYDYGFVFSVN